MEAQSADGIVMFLEMLDDYSGNSLNERDAVERLLLTAHSAGQPETIAKLAFQGKYVTRLVAALSRHTAAGGGHAEKLEEELADAVNEFRVLLTEAAAHAGEQWRSTMDLHYLAASDSSLRNLLSLARDLTWLKDFELAIERQDQSGSGQG